jgi:hypothetical protein
MALKNARLASLREKLESKVVDAQVEAVVEAVEEGVEPAPYKPKARHLKK